MKKLIYTFIIFILFISTAYCDNFKVFIGLTQPITPAMVIEQNNKLLVSLDILEKLDIDYKSGLKNKVLLTEINKTIPLHNQFGIMLIDIFELTEALDIEYIKKDNNITIYNRINSVTCANGYVNIKFAFSSAYEYSYWSNKFVVDLVGANYNKNVQILNKDTKNITNISFGQVNLDSTRVVLDLFNPVPNQKPIRSNGKELNIKLNTGFAKKSYNITNLNIYKQDKNTCIYIAGGADLKYSLDEDLNTGEFSFKITNGVFDKSIQKKLKVNNIGFTINDKSISCNLDYVQGISTKVKVSDLLITLSPVKGTKKAINELIVTLDPGHGDKDVGAKYKDLFEKNINYRACEITKNILESHGIKVIMTRDSEGFLSLGQRGQVAIDNNSDVFISIHTNSTVGENKASGVETFYRDKMYSSRYLGELIHGEIIKGLPIPNKGLKRDTMLYKSGLGVLSKCNSGGIPCILIELGFINHQTDRQYLQSDEYLTEIGNQIYSGLEKYVKGYPINKLK